MNLQHLLFANCNGKEPLIFRFDRPLHQYIKKFLETGSVQDLPRTGRPSTITEEKIEKVQELLEDEPINNVRSVAREAKITKYQAHRIMRDILGYKPYMMHSTQKLYDEDMDLRVEMAEHLIPILEDPENNGNIFFSDESTFYTSGLVNKHNCRIWAEKNPYITMESAMKSAKINVWCAMSNKEIIGPYFLKMKRSISIIILTC